MDFNPSDMLQFVNKLEYYKIHYYKLSPYFIDPMHHDKLNIIY